MARHKSETNAQDPGQPCQPHQLPIPFSPLSEDDDALWEDVDLLPSPTISAQTRQKFTSEPAIRREDSDIEFVDDYVMDVVHGPALLDDREDQIYSDWGGLLALSKPLQEDDETSVDLECDNEVVKMVDLVPTIPADVILENLSKTFTQHYQLRHNL